MEWIRKYWPILTTVIVMLLGVGGLQAQVLQNSEALEKKADTTAVEQVAKDLKEAKEQAEKDFEEAKKEREDIEKEQKLSTELRINQRHMRDDMKEMKDSFKEVLKEIRGMKK